MRFGAMFSVGDPAKAGTLRWQPKKTELELELTPLGEGLFGEVAQARFKSLALALKAQPVVTQARGMMRLDHLAVSAATLEEGVGGGRGGAWRAAGAAAGSTPRWARTTGFSGLATSIWR